MTKSVDRRYAESLLPSGRWSYELAKTPDAAVELLRTPANPPILSSEQAKRARGTESFIVLRDAGFTIYKPWRSSREVSPEGALAGDITVGPAVVGQLVPTPGGSRLDVCVRRYAPAPSQRYAFGIAIIALSGFVIAPIAIAGTHPVALGLAAFSLIGGAASHVFFRRRQRSQDIRDLLAVVQRTFGPLELPSGEEVPHRRSDPHDDEY